MKATRTADLLRDVGLYAFAIALPFNLWTVQAGLGLVVLSLVVRVLARGRAGPLPEVPLPLAAPLALYAVAVIVSMLGSGEPLPPLHDALGFWPIAAPVLLVLAIPDVKTLSRMWWLTAAMAALMGLYGVVQHFTGADWFRVHTTLSRAAPASPGRFLAIGNFEAHTTYAFSLAFPALMAVAFASELRRARARLLFFAVAIAIAAGILVSYVRAIWLGLVVGVALLAFLRRGPMLKLAIGAVVVLGIAVATVPALRARAVSIFDSGYNVGRAYIWERSWKMLADHPASGIGYGGYRRLQDAYFDPAAPADEVPRTGAHSTYLHLAVELGALGLLAYLWLWLSVLRRGLVAYRREGAGPRAPDALSRGLVVGAIAGIACFLAGSFFQEAYFDGEVAFMLWLAVASIFVVARGPS